MSPRWIPCIEKISYSFTIDNPYIITWDFVDRPFSWKYLAAELVWYLSWDLSIFRIEKYASLWWRIADWTNQINSNYWYITLHKRVFWRTQYDIVLDNLREDKDTRQALMRYNSHEHVYPGNKDFPCTISNQFFIRDWKLHLIVNMRSNDMFFWFQYDVVWFWLLLQSMSLSLWVTPWKIHWHTGSAHVYNTMWEKAKSIIDSKWEWVSYSLWLRETFPILRNKILTEWADYYWNTLEKNYRWMEKEFIRQMLWIEISEYTQKV